MWIFNALVPVACYFHFSQAVKSSCMAPPVKHGDEATLSCRFDVDISKLHRDVVVYLYKDVHSSERMTSFIVTEKAASQAHDIFIEQQDAENTLYIVTVVLGAVFGVLVVIFLTILIITVYNGWISIRCCTHDEESINSNKPNKYIYNPPSTDTKKIKTIASQQQGLLA